MQSGISRRTTTVSSTPASTTTTSSTTLSNNVYRSRPATLIPPPNKVALRTIEDKKMVGTTVKPSTIRRPSSRETIAMNNSSRLANGLSRPPLSSSNTSTTTNRSVKIDSTPAPTSRTFNSKPSNQMHFAVPTTASRRLANGTINNNNKDSQSVNKTESKLTVKRNEFNSTSASARKSVAPPSTLNNTTTTSNGTTINGNNSVPITGTSKKSGTATARAATTLISLQKECDKYRRLADLYKRQLETSKGDVTKSVMVVDGLSVVVKYLTEHLNAFSTPSLKATIERQSGNYEKLKGDYSKLENVLEQMRQENTRKEDDLKDEIVRMSLEMVNEKKRHDNEKNRLFDMFEDQMEAQKKAFKREMERIDEEKVNLEKVIDSLQEEIKEKMSQIERLTGRVTELESSLSMEKDRRCRMLQDKVKFMTSEIQSLKDVLDLKDGELRNLKTSIANEELLRQELATAQQSIINLTQRLEQLEISANQKNAMINMLKEENESLRERYNREQRERRRISMKNEELEYTLSEFTTPCKGNSSSTDEDIFLTPMQPPTTRTRLTLASVPPSRPHSTDSIRKARASYSVSRPSHHHTKCFQPSSSSNILLPPSSSTESSTVTSTSTTTSSRHHHHHHHHRRSSASVKLTFQDANDSELINNQQTINNRNMDNQDSRGFNLPDSYDIDDDDNVNEGGKGDDSVTTPNFDESNVYSVNNSSKSNMIVTETIGDDDDDDEDTEHWCRNRRRPRGTLRANEQIENQDGHHDDEDEDDDDVPFGASSFSAIRRKNSNSKTIIYHNISSGDDSNQGLNTTLVELSQSSSSSSSPVNNTPRNHFKNTSATTPTSHKNKNLIDQQISSSSASSSTNGEGTSGMGSSLNSISVNSGVTFRSDKSEYNSESESVAPKSLPSILPQSILDSGFEDIEGLIAFR